MSFVFLQLGIKQKRLIQHLVPFFLVLKAKPQLTPPVVELTGSRSGQRRRHGPLMFHTVRNKQKGGILCNIIEMKYLDN